MSIIFDSIKTRNLDQVFEINLNQYFRHFTSESLDNAGVDDASFSVAVSSGMNNPAFNAVLQTDITDNFEQVFDTAHSFFTSKNLAYTWYIIPSHQPDNLQDLLRSKGLRKTNDNVIVGIELKDLPRNISSPNSLYIEAIDNYEKYKTWVEIYCRFANIKGEAVEQYKLVHQHTDFNDPNLPFVKYIGWLNGEPIAISTLILSGGVAVMYDEGILPKYKGFGIEDAINITPLKKAMEMGYMLGMIQTSIGGMKRFTSLGFKELFYVNKMVHLPRAARRRR